MGEMTEWFSNSIRLCPACLRKSERHRVLCYRCANYAVQFQYRQWARWQEGVPILSLYEWDERAHGLFQTYANHLKGGGTPNIYQSLAADILILRAQQKKFADRTTTLPWVIVPAPAAQESLRDHAGELAFQIAQLSDAEYLPCLKRLGQKSQKQKSLKERWMGSPMQLKGDLPRSDRQYIWVDDVITTGSTASNAYKLLGRPPFFEIWTLFNRPRLRGRG